MSLLLWLRAGRLLWNNLAPAAALEASQQLLEPLAGMLVADILGKQVWCSVAVGLGCWAIEGWQRVLSLQLLGAGWQLKHLMMLHTVRHAKFCTSGPGPRPSCCLPTAGDPVQDRL
jgi:hypothetical protein